MVGAEPAGQALQLAAARVVGFQVALDVVAQARHLAGQVAVGSDPEQAGLGGVEIAEGPPEGRAGHRRPHPLQPGPAAAAALGGPLDRLQVLADGRPPMVAGVGGGGLEQPHAQRVELLGPGQDVLAPGRRDRLPDRELRQVAMGPRRQRRRPGDGVGHGGSSQAVPLPGVWHSREGGVVPLVHWPGVPPGTPGARWPCGAGGPGRGGPGRRWGGPRPGPARGGRWRRRPRPGRSR